MNYRAPFFPPPYQQYPPKITINELPNQKQNNSSQYRTHFTLMNVYCPIGSNYQQFLLKISQKLKKYVNVDIVQISQVVDDQRVDLAIGLQNDKDAMIFLMKNQDIKIDTQKYGEETYTPIVSNVFKTYMNAKRHLFPQIMADMSRKQPIKPLFQLPKQITSQKSIQQPVHSSPHKSRYSHSRSSSYSSSSSSRSSSQNSPQKGNYLREHKRSQRQRSRSKEKTHIVINKLEETSYGFNQNIRQNTMVHDIWIFCIPLQFDERDIQSKFKQKRINWANWSWKMVQDMEYLQLNLDRTIALQTIHSLDIKIGGYPILIMPKMRNQTQLRQQMRKYQSQLISINPIKQQLLMKCLIQIGGVISVIKDDYDDNNRQKYFITFSTTSRIKQILGNQISVGPSEELIRFCRTQKSFAIQNIINQYAEKFKKTQY